MIEAKLQQGPNGWCHYIEGTESDFMMTLWAVLQEIGNCDAEIGYSDTGMQCITVYGINTDNEFALMFRCARLLTDRRVDFKAKEERANDALALLGR